MAKIVTSHIYPPIPIRSHDWCAYYDGQEESGQYGYGPTEAEAIQDLRDNYDEPPPFDEQGWDSQHMEQVQR